MHPAGPNSFRNPLLAIGRSPGQSEFAAVDGCFAPTAAQSEEKKLTLDVSRCGGGWCGVEVTNGSMCGRTVLRLSAGDQGGNESVGFNGRLHLAPESEPYGVHTILLRRGEVPALIMIGQAGGRFFMGSRRLDFQAEFVRTSDAVCQPDAKVS